MLNYYQLLATGNWKLATALSPSIRNTQYDIRSTKDYVRKNKLFMQNKANFRKVKLNVNKVLTRNYDQMDTWSIRKTKPIKANQSQLKPIQSQLKPIKRSNKPKQTQFQGQKNAALRYYAVGYLRKKCYSIAVYIGNLRLISRLMAKEQLK